MRRERLLEPGDAVGDARGRARQAGHLHGLGLLHERRRDDDPRLVLREHAGAKRGGRDRELDFADPELPRDAIEQEARGVAAPRGDAVAPREAERAEVRPQNLALDAGDGRRDLEQDMSAFGRVAT